MKMSNVFSRKLSTCPTYEESGSVGIETSLISQHNNVSIICYMSPNIYSKPYYI